MTASIFSKVMFCAALACAIPASSAFADRMHEGAHGAAAFGKPGDPKKIDRTITIEASEIAFNVKTLTVKKGETVRFVLVNKGEQPHELTIGGPAEQLAHRKLMADMGGMEMSGMSHNDGNSISAEPGETKELVWTFTTAGKFEFACNYPGHAESGMEGPLVVQ